MATGTVYLSEGWLAQKLVFELNDMGRT